MYLRLLFLLVLVLVHCLPAHAAAPDGCASSLPQPRLEQARSVDDSAALLAGRPVAPDSPYAAVMADPAWKRHAAQLDASFAKLERGQLAAMREWAASELAGHSASLGPVYYPFSGPDLVYLLNLFPDAHSYVLTGLEPVGELPRFDALDGPGLQRGLRAIGMSLYALLEFSFFRTNDLSAHIDSTQLNGVIPILMLFLERMDYQMLAVERFRLDRSGRWCPLDAKRVDKTDVAGVRIQFLRRGERAVRQLVYFSADIGDGGLARTPQYEAYIRALGPKAVLYKSASYLPHKPYFSRVRDLSLQQAELLLQDDSGIPYRHFAADQWSARLYGRYAGPISLFSNMRQPDLAQAYAKSAPGPLPFSYGYQHRRGSSGVMLFVRQPGG